MKTGEQDQQAPAVDPYHFGWRSVKLQWEDGYWWFSKTATKYDWWRLKYW